MSAALWSGGEELLNLAESGSIAGHLLASHWVNISLFGNSCVLLPSLFPEHSAEKSKSLLAQSEL